MSISSRTRGLTLLVEERLLVEGPWVQRSEVAVAAGIGVPSVQLRLCADWTLSTGHALSPAPVVLTLEEPELPRGVLHALPLLRSKRRGTRVFVVVMTTGCQLLFSIFFSLLAKNANNQHIQHIHNQVCQPQALKAACVTKHHHRHHHTTHTLFICAIRQPAAFFKECKNTSQFSLILLGSSWSQSGQADWDQEEEELPVPSADRASGTQLSGRGLLLVGIWAGSSPPGTLPSSPPAGAATSC